MASIAITTAFIPVSDPPTAARWYSETLGLELASSNPASAVLESGTGASLTLLGPASGIKAVPGLPWATCNFKVQDLPGKHAELRQSGMPVGAVQGSPDVCRFFTMADPDGNTLLVTDR